MKRELQYSSKQHQLYVGCRETLTFLVEVSHLRGQVQAIDGIETLHRRRPSHRAVVLFAAPERRLPVPANSASVSQYAEQTVGRTICAWRRQPLPRLLPPGQTANPRAQP